MLVLAALAAVLAALAVGGGAEPLLIGDPGPLVRWGLPLAKTLSNLAYAGAVGGLLLALVALPFGSAVQHRVLDLAASAAAAWTVAAAGTALLAFLHLTGLPLSVSDAFGAAMAQYFIAMEAGQAQLITVLAAAGVTVLALAVRRPWPLALLTAGAMAAVLPLAQQGHAAGVAGHGAAVTALALHMVGAAIWIGGLLVLVLLRSRLGEQEQSVVARYSSIALMAGVVVAASGLVSAQLRLGADGLTTPYGALALTKAVLLTGLMVFGVVHRRRMIAGLAAGGAAGRRRFWSLVVVELGIMGLASGVATALARTPTPVPEELPPQPTPAELLTGEPLPPVFEPLRLLTEWRFDLLWSLVALFLAVWYLLGVLRLHRRGDRWPVHRTVLWLLGLALLWWVTNGALNVYQGVLFSAHMLAHMVLTMVVPLLLVPAAPITLALRAISPRGDGSRGGREWLLALVHSRWLRVLGHPVVAAVLFAGSLWLFYYSPLFRWAVTDHLGHHWMIAHFLLLGYLFVQSLIGVDPGAAHAPYPLRLVVLFATMAFHAFFGLGLMMGGGLLLADWFGAMGWQGGLSALQDQQDGGGIAWGIGELPTVTLAILVALQWSRSDERESRRRDRHAERTGDAELAEYNAMLRRLADRR